MPEVSQKTIEYFFKKHSVADPDKKAKLLPMLTDTIYDYNTSVVHYEKETDDYRKNQILNEIQEAEEKIKETIDEVLEEK